MWSRDVGDGDHTETDYELQLAMLPLWPVDTCAQACALLTLDKWHTDFDIFTPVYINNKSILNKSDARRSIFCQALVAFSEQ